MLAQLGKILWVFEGKKGALISILQRVQEEFGYLPQEALTEIATFLKLPPSHVFSVATFYAHFYLTRRGDHLVRVCQGTACHVRGGAILADTISRELGVRPGGTTDDMEFSLETVNCLGCCAIGPIVVVDGEYHGEMTNQKVLDLFKKYRGEKNDSSKS